MPFTSPNQALGVRKPGLAVVPHVKKKKSAFKPASLQRPIAPKPQTVTSLGGLKAAALGGKPIAMGSEGF